MSLNDLARKALYQTKKEEDKSILQMDSVGAFEICENCGHEQSSHRAWQKWNMGAGVGVKNRPACGMSKCSCKKYKGLYDNSNYRSPSDRETKKITNIPERLKN